MTDAPPTALDVQNGDFLGVLAQAEDSTVSIILSLLTWTKRGGYSVTRHQIAPATTAIPTEINFALSESTLVSAAASITPSTYAHARCWLRVSLYSRAFRDANHVETILAGELTGWTSLTWPRAPIQQPRNIHPVPTRIAVPNPAAGSGAAYTLPAFMAFDIVSAVETIICGALPPNRTPIITVTDAIGTRVFLGAVDANHLSAPGSSNQILFQRNFYINTILTPLRWGALPDRMLAPAGSTITLTADGLQAADQIQNVSIWGNWIPPQV